ncbi:MAG TPA: ComEC/Rec2 family competence protein [Phycisphaerae bacterium]|nr:ComEC/Rec2 family competence protein [Phycisphaerae bacterium]
MIEPIAHVPGRARGVRRYQPLVAAAMAFVAGILLAEFLGGGMGLWCAVALAAAGAWAVCYYRGVGDHRLLVPLMVLVVAAGAARYRSSTDPAPDDVGRLVADGMRLVVIEGVVVRPVRQAPPPSDVFLPDAPGFDRNRLTIDCSRAQIEGRWVPACGRAYTSVRCALPKDGAGVPNLGDRVQVRGRLARPMEPAAPGGFDMPTYLRRQGVRACLYTDHWEAIRIVEPGADRLRWLVGAMGRWAEQRFKSIRSPEGRRVAAAIVLGRRDLLRFETGEIDAQDIERSFVVTGTAHFLAVSGFSVGLAAAVVLLATRLIGLGPRPTAVLVAAVVLAYALMTDLAPPVVRAAILIGVMCLAWVLGRERILLNSVAASVLLILLIRPGDLFTTSFQLSFAVVVGMFWLLEKVETTVFRRRREEEPLAFPLEFGRFSAGQYLRQTAALSVAAALVSVPLVAYRFHLVSWLAPVGSVLLAPLVFVLVAGSMALVAVGGAVPWLSDLVAAVPDGMARAIVGVTGALARVPGGHFYIAEFSGVWLVVAYGLMASWVWRARLGISRRRLAMAALAAAAVFLWTGGHRAPAALRATFLPVGSGNTTLVEFPNGRTILYDAGSALSLARAAEIVTAPALWSRGIERVDAIFISHAHFDHFKDILPLIDRFGVQRVWVPPTFLRKRLTVDDNVILALLARGVAVELFGAGDRLAGTGGVDVRGVWPRGQESMTDEVNDGSLVLVMEDRGRRLLLTGDVEPAAIAGLIAAEPHLRADAMLWPHHGHAEEAVGDLARHTGATTLVISAASQRRPPPVPPWLKQYGITCLHTGRSGAVTVDLGLGGVRASTFRGGVQAVTGATPAE